MINTNEILITNVQMDKLQHRTDLEVEFSVLSGLNLNKKMNFHHSRPKKFTFYESKNECYLFGVGVWPRSWGKTY